MADKKIAVLGLIHACADKAMGYMDDSGDCYYPAVGSVKGVAASK